jgi:arylsulfatase A-like enzyme
MNTPCTFTGRDAPGTATLLDVVTASLWFAFVAATADAVIVYGDFMLSRRGIQYVPWIFWPMGVVMWSVIGVVAAVIAFAVFRSPSLAVTGAFLSGVGVVAVVRGLVPMATAFHTTHVRWLLLASLSIAIALGVGLANVVKRWSPFAPPVVIATFAIVGLSALALMLHALPAGTPRRQSTGSGARNVVLIFLDTVRYDAAISSAPQLCAFAAGGIVFDRAITPAPWTVPSHLAVMAGVPANILDVDFEHQSLTSPDTLAVTFRRRGYATGAIFSNYILTPGTGIARGFDDFEISERGLDFDRTAAGELLRMLRRRRGSNRDGRWCEWLAPEISARARTFIRATKPPYFLALNYADAHDPYPDPCLRGVPSLQYSTEYLPALAANMKGTPLPDGANTRLHDSYRSAVRCMDVSLGPILDELRPSVDRGETIVAVVGDHGEGFGEHRMWFHGNSTYQQEVHVPMIIRGGGLSPSRVAIPVSTVALHDMLLRLAETTSAGESLDDVNLSLRRYPVMARHDPARGSTGPTSNPSLALYDGNLAVVTRGMGVELYDVDRDPQETLDLAADPQLRQRRETLRARLATLQRGHHPQPDRDPLFRGLGYLQ